MDLALIPLLLGTCSTAGTPRSPRAVDLSTRAGVVMAASVPREALDLLGPVWYYTYGFGGQSLEGHPRVLLIRPHYDEEAAAEALREAPGSWWLVGNEPNDPYQDDLSPGAYAALYGRFEALARRTDPTCRIVAGGVANADTLWADAFRHAYRDEFGVWPAPDAWHIHNYILEPERDQLDLAEFQKRIVAFRAWMDDIGDKDLPLFLTEFGALYGLHDGHLGRPEEDPERVAGFVREAVAWLYATDHVQHFAWFATGTAGQFNGDLYDASGALTPVGQAYREAIGQEVH
jgi:hypothetical protein